MVHKNGTKRNKNTSLNTLAESHRQEYAGAIPTFPSFLSSINATLPIVVLLVAIVGSLFLRHQNYVSNDVAARSLLMKDPSTGVGDEGEGESPSARMKDLVHEVLQFDERRIAVVRHDDRTGERALYLSKSVKQGDVLLEISESNMIIADRLDIEYPSLRAIVKELLTGKSSPSTTEVLLTIAGLLEVRKGQSSRFASYLQTLPPTPMTLSMFWTDEERQCSIDGAKSADTLHNFLSAFHQLQARFRLLANTSDSTAIHMYSMVKTRAFGGRLIPVLDLANHAAQHAVPPFSTRNAKGEPTHYLLAGKDADEGSQLYNSYGSLSVTELVERYGFADDEAVLVTVHSLLNDMEQHAETSTDAMFHKLCTGSAANFQFFGPRVPAGKVDASFGTLRQTMTVLAGRPTQLTFQCTRVLLNEPSGVDMAKYFASKLREEILKFEVLTRKPQCNEGGSEVFQLIHRGNLQALEALESALSVAEDAAQGLIEYPGIAYP